MPAFSSDVLAVYRTADPANVRDVRYEVVSGPCWFRGIVFYMDNSGSAPGENAFFKFWDGETGPRKIELPFGNNKTFSQFLVPDECYVDFDNGIWVEGDLNPIIQNLYMTVFYSQ